MRKRSGTVAALVMVLATVAVKPALGASPPNGGTIAIVPVDAGVAQDPAASSFVIAVTDALAAKGFTVLNDPNHAASTLELGITRSNVGTALSRVPRQGRPTLSGGLVVPLSTGKSDVLHLQRVRLALRIRRRGDTSTVWHGAAISVREADLRVGTDQRIATDLSGALLEGYPRQPGGVVGVP